MESLRSYRGFTLIELLVVLAIITVIMGIALSSQSGFNKSLLVSNTAYDIALALRSAETYGLGTRVSQGTIYDAGYGLHFDKTSPSTFLLFSDKYPASSVASDCHPSSGTLAPDAKAGDCAYQASEGERVTTYMLGNGITVSDFCAYAGGSWSCATSGGAALTTLDIVFARPNPDPFMSTNGTYSVAAPVTNACLTITSPQGGFRYVSISASGAINANATSCP